MSTFETILAADIGGTNTRVLLYEINTTDHVLKQALPQGKLAPGRLLFQKQYMNHEYEKFTDILKNFLKEAYVTKPPMTACFAVAGPVKDNVVRFTNRAAWVVDGDAIAKELNFRRVHLVNDFVANGYGLLTLNEEKECIVLQKGNKDRNAPIACIGPGTGLGECFLAPYGNGYKCYPTEGGHAEFPPRNDLEVSLLNFLKVKFEQRHRVSIERVVSGPGLANVYEFLRTEYPDKVIASVDEEFEKAGDLKGAVIARSAPHCELCQKTMEIFVSAYGSEAGIAGLKYLPYGGLYLTGGLTPKNIDLIRDPSGPFMAALLDKGRVSGMLDTIPIYAVMVEDLGQRGAHLVAYQDFVDILKKSEETPKKTTVVSKSPEANRACAYDHRHLVVPIIFALVAKYLSSRK